MHTLHIHIMCDAHETVDAVRVCIAFNDLERFVRMQRMSYSVPILYAYVLHLVSWYFFSHAFLCLVCYMCQSRMETTPNKHGLVASAAAALCLQLHVYYVCCKRRQCALCVLRCFSHHNSTVRLHSRNARCDCKRITFHNCHSFCTRLDGLRTVMTVQKKSTLGYICWPTPGF